MIGMPEWWEKSNSTSPVMKIKHTRFSTQFSMLHNMCTQKLVYHTGHRTKSTSGDLSIQPLPHPQKNKINEPP